MYVVINAYLPLPQPPPYSFMFDMYRMCISEFSVCVSVLSCIGTDIPPCELADE